MNYFLKNGDISIILPAGRSRNEDYKSFLSKEKQIWAIVAKKIKAKENNRKRPSLIQRKDEN